MRALTVLFLSFLTVISFSSCKDDEHTIAGRLNVVVTYNGEPVVNAMVSLATSKTNLNKGIYVKQSSTDKDGLADFGAVEPGSYYFDAFKYTNNNQDYLYANSVIDIRSQIKHEEVLTLVKK